MLIGTVNETRMSSFLASFPSQAAYSDLNRSYIESAWQGATSLDNLTFQVPDPTNSSNLLAYHGLLFLGNYRNSYLYAYLVVFNLVRNPLDSSGGSYPVHGALFIDARAVEPLASPEAGESVSHVFDYGSTSVPVWFDGNVWQVDSKDSSANQAALGTGYGISDGRNTTYIFEINLDSSNPGFSALQLPPNLTWPLGMSVYLGFNEYNASAYAPFQEPRSCWPSAGAGGNPDGFLHASTYFPFRIDTY